LKPFFHKSWQSEKKSDFNCLNPKGEFYNRPERALGLSKNVLEPAKNDLATAR
jgi:hypothetical protein